MIIPVIGFCFVVVMFVLAVKNNKLTKFGVYFEFISLVIVGALVFVVQADSSAYLYFLIAHVLLVNHLPVYTESDSEEGVGFSFSITLGKS